MARESRPSDGFEVKTQIYEEARAYIWNFAQVNYGYNPRNYKHSERIRKIGFLLDALLENDFSLFEIKEGVEKACKEYLKIQKDYMPPGIKIIEKCQEVRSNRKQEEETGNTDYIGQAAQQRAWVSEIKDIISFVLFEDHIHEIKIKYHKKVGDIEKESQYKELNTVLKESFWWDFILQKSIAREIISSLMLDEEVEIEQENGTKKKVKIPGHIIPGYIEWKRKINRK